MRRGPEGIAIFIADEEPVGSRILYVNAAFLEMSGYTADQLVGHSAILLAGARPSLEAARAAFQVRRGRPYVARERKFRPDGSSYEAEVRLEYLSPSRGQLPRLVLTQREIAASVGYAGAPKE